jgi:uncharacterized DUF497 family protein
MASILSTLGKSLSFPCSLTSTLEKFLNNGLDAIGFLRQHVVVGIFVEGEDDTIRFISLRKALKHERERFEEFLRNELGTD